MFEQKLLLFICIQNSNPVINYGVIFVPRSSFVRYVAAIFELAKRHAYTHTQRKFLTF